MYKLLEIALETVTLLILWNNGASGESTAQEFSSAKVSNLADWHSWIIGRYANKREIDKTLANRSLGNLQVDRTTDLRSYYGGVPASPYIPAFDPISVLASLAFLAFLLQSFAALFDRTRSIIPTIISSRQSNSEYNERFADTEKRVLRALEEYASLSNNLLDSEKESEKSVL